MILNNNRALNYVWNSIVPYNDLYIFNNFRYLFTSYHMSNKGNTAHGTDVP